MRGKLKLSQWIRRFWAALLCLSAVADTGLTAETQTSFAGKTIRVVVPVAPGGGLDLQSRALAPLLQAHILGNPSVVVQNVPGAGGIVAGNLFMREQGPELTILQCHIGHPLYQLLGHDIKYDVRRWHFLGGSKRDFMPIFQRAELPYANIGEWTQAKNPIVWSADTLGSTVENPARIMRLAGVKIRIVSGYPGGTARLLAVLRGEADATPEVLSTAKPHLDAGKLKVVGRLIPPQIPGYPDAPYVLNTFAFTEEQKILYGVAEAPWHLQTCWLVREETPKGTIQVLRDAVKRAITSADYESAMQKVQLGGDYMSPEEIQEKFIKPQLGIPADLQEKFRKMALDESDRTAAPK
ncbi:MAG TPA: tripartite tricarboxylate transporter substrate-binding protein [Candidatus Binatia bacterium]|nr:tripartite tricarboxylate transporter substrate-binding protein [Candidatus Binatia bacterium]